MTYRAKQGFTTRHEGRRVRYGRGDVVPDAVAAGRGGLVSRVEQATAAPGEVRDVTFSCDDCGVEAKTNAGLSAHKRSHQ